MINKKVILGKCPTCENAIFRYYSTEGICMFCSRVFSETELGELEL
jgi:ribosomal protein S27E